MGGLEFRVSLGLGFRISQGLGLRIEFRDVRIVGGSRVFLEFLGWLRSFEGISGFGEFRGFFWALGSPKLNLETWLRISSLAGFGAWRPEKLGV